MNEIMALGAGRPLQLDDMYAMPDELHARPLAEQFDEQWKIEVEVPGTKFVEYVPSPCTGSFMSRFFVLFFCFDQMAETPR